MNPLDPSESTILRTCSKCGTEYPLSEDSSGESICGHCRANDHTLTATLPLTEPSPESAPVARKKPSGVTPGDVLGERFRVIRALGRGGMGEVFEVQDQVLDERVALKVVRARDGESEENLLRLRQEVLLARRVTHNNVCRIFDLVHDRDERTGASLALVSMELLSGETLSQLLSDRGPMSQEDMLPLVRQIARGLAAAHRLGIVHRDLKPSNVMLVHEDEGLRVAITDFGLAQSIGPEGKPENALTQKGQLVGTPAYMTPEQLSGESTSTATDLYSLGIMIYEMLAGELPFRGSSPWHLAISRLTDSPRPLRELRPDLAPAIHDLVDRCLEKDPAKRLSSASELLGILDFGDTSWDVYGRKAPVEIAAGQKRRQAIWLASGLLLALTASGLWRLVTTPGEAPAPGSLATSSARVDQALSDLPALPGLADPDRSAPAGDDPAMEAVARSLREFDGAAALDILEEALADRPRDPRLLRQQAEALWRQGRESAALPAIAAAKDHSSSLARFEQTLIDALHLGMSGDWLRAREVLESLWRSQPEDLEIGLWLAEATWRSGWVVSMEDHLLALRNLLPEHGSDPRIDLWQARLARRNGDYELQKRAALRVVETARSRGSRLLQFAGLRLQARADQSLGHDLEYGQGIEHLQRLSRDVGDPLFMAHADLEHARSLERLGREEAALGKLLEADAAYSELGALSSRCRLFGMFGLLESLPDGKIESLERGLELCARAGLGANQALLRYQLARAWRDRAEFPRAAQLFQESASQMESLGDQNGLALSRIGLGFLYRRMGRVEDMRQTLLAVEPWFEDKADIEKLSVTLLGIAEATVYSGPIAEAKEALDRLAAYEPSGTRLLDLYLIRCRLAWQIGDGDELRSAARGLRDLARNLLAEDYVKEAKVFEAASLALDDDVRESLEALGRLDWTVSILPSELATHLHLENGDFLLAKDSLAAMQAAGAPTEQRDLWKIEIFTAYLGASSDPRQAARRLGVVERQARDWGLHLLALEARKLRARIENDDEALREVAESARQLGFLRLAREAGSLRADSSG